MNIYDVSNWNTDDADLTDFTDFVKVLFENKTFYITLIIKDMNKFMNYTG